MLQVSELPSFLRLNNVPLCGWVTFGLFFHPSVDTYVGCFHILAVVNNAAINLDLQTFKTLLSLREMPEFELLDRTVPLVLVFKETPYCFHSGVTVLHPRPQGPGSCFCASSPALAVSWIWVAAVPAGGSFCSSLKPAIRCSTITDTCSLSPVVPFDGRLLREKRCGALVVLNLTSAASPASGLSPHTLLQDRGTSLYTPASLWLIFLRLPF